ncbi:NAD(P)/FAD-dependent oxidoreductase [Prauserella muralis]|uniref:NAD(P)/FAD-dependent oxidoreductase n=1 Tax=Prauserella muralis TaxID=588067 RepID=UPI000DD3937A|nr:NAD(P)/FAD-dependent oxidoreductase [Prauserella muralis]TWE28739.1 NADPH-dependent 2,4-dienoyl-CoA reductase/sulfur reductase-like enzyme [Prauserella muralis]
MRRVAIVGAGLAGLTAAQELRRLGYDGALVLVGAEPFRPYRRPPLSKEYLLTADDRHLTLADGDLDDLAATWLLGHAATGLDLPGRRVLRGTLPPVDFDGLVIATGAGARNLPDGGHLPGVMTLRSLDDARMLRARLADRPRVVIAGAGFLGSEIAATLRALDLPVTLVSPDPVPLHRPLGRQVGALVADLHRAHAVDLRLHRRVTAVTGDPTVRQVHLDDGTALPADLVVVAVGARPRVEWLRGSGLRLDDGVVVDGNGLAAPGVVAAGDVARWPQPALDGELLRVEHYSNAIDQGAHAARALLGYPGRFAPVPSFWGDLYGRKLRSVGLTGIRYDTHLVASEPGGRFLAEYHRDGGVVGAVTAGFTHSLAHYRDLIAKQMAAPVPAPTPFRAS